MQLGSGSERLALRCVHGEAHPQAAALNLRGRVYQVYDGAGVVTNQAHDFKGNLLQASRRLRSDVYADADWSALAALTDVAAIGEAAEPLLEAESFDTQTVFFNNDVVSPNAQYVYDAAGQRVRKVWVHSGLVEERIYLGGYEVYRRRNGSGITRERQTPHVMDGARRVAMVETRRVCGDKRPGFGAIR